MIRSSEKSGRSRAGPEWCRAQSPYVLAELVSPRRSICAGDFHFDDEIGDAIVLLKRLTRYSTSLSPSSSLRLTRCMEPMSGS
jgi:hypothetical protein